MARKAEHGPVRAALEVTIQSDARLSEARHAALIALARVTADQVDQAGAEVSSRLIASYLSALKDVERAMGQKLGAPVGAPQQGGGSGATLGNLRALAGGKS